MLRPAPLYSPISLCSIIFIHVKGGLFTVSGNLLTGPNECRRAQKTKQNETVNAIKVGRVNIVLITVSISRTNQDGNNLQ